MTTPLFFFLFPRSVVAISNFVPKSPIFTLNVNYSQQPGCPSYFVFCRSVVLSCPMPPRPAWRNAEKCLLAYCFAKDPFTLLSLLFSQPILLSQSRTFSGAVANHVSASPVTMGSTTYLLRTPNVRNTPPFHFRRRCCGSFEPIMLHDRRRCARSKPALACDPLTQTG